MGVYTSCYLRVGYLLDPGAVTAKFLRVVSPRTWKTEDRYDPKTGQKVDPVKVIDSYGEKHFEFNNKFLAVDEENLLFQAIADYVGGDYCSFSDGNRRQVAFIVDSGEHEFVGELVETGRCTFGSHLNYEHVVKVAPLVQKIGQGLKDLGLYVDQPLVIHEVDIG